MTSATETPTLPGTIASSRTTVKVDTTGIAAPRWPIGLLGAVAIIVAAEGYVARRKDDLTSIYAIEWRLNARSIRRHAAGSSVLCFGTSLTRMGVSPRVLEETMRLPAYNFAMSGAQPFACYVALRDALASGAKPRAVLVDFTWSTLGQPYTFNEMGLPEMATLRDCAEFALAAPRRLVLRTDGPGVAAAVVQGPDRGPGQHRGRHPRRGAEPESRSGSSTRGTPRSTAGPATRARSATTARSTRRIPCSSRRSGPAPRPARRTSTSSSTSPRRGTSPSSGSCRRWRRGPRGPGRHRGSRRDTWASSTSIAARHANVTVIDATESRYAVEAFNDPVHLNRDGAVVFSADAGRRDRGEARQGRRAGAATDPAARTIGPTPTRGGSRTRGPRWPSSRARSRRPAADRRAVDTNRRNGYDSAGPPDRDGPRRAGTMGASGIGQAGDTDGLRRRRAVLVAMVRRHPPLRGAAVAGHRVAGGPRAVLRPRPGDRAPARPDVVARPGYRALGPPRLARRAEAAGHAPGLEPGPLLRRPRPRGGPSRSRSA